MIIYHLPPIKGTRNSYWKTDLFDGGSFPVVVWDFLGATTFMKPFKLRVPWKSPFSGWRMWDKTKAENNITIFLLGRPIFGGNLAVSFREGIPDFENAKWSGDLYESLLALLELSKIS